MTLSGPQIASDMVPQQIVLILVPVGDLISSQFVSYSRSFEISSPSLPSTKLLTRREEDMGVWALSARMSYPLLPHVVGTSLPGSLSQQFFTGPFLGSPCQGAGMFSSLQQQNT